MPLVSPEDRSITRRCRSRVRRLKPPAASPAVVGWGWFINLRQGDRIVVQLSGPDGQPIAINRSDPMDRAKASYSAFAGKKGAPKPGVYEVEVAVERNGSMLFERGETYSIE